MILKTGLNFRNVNLQGSDFSEFDFIDSKFIDSSLNFIRIKSVKFLILNKSIFVENSSNFAEIIQNLKLDLN